ncbi:hypothetical protein [Curvivirga aplysinae]|uniref:hypothetical protein n=1 Tax=Curvivirga aplysinae TaxID=2529852 RepID=UPI0012BD293F|nr:hypothetical protein [Curvivirga aplysinae]MTI11401.1 hypothetical protein [Curvivirga aplysinae]
MSNTQYDIPDWVTEHRIRTWNWFNTIQTEGHPSWIRLCAKGDLLKPDHNAGLGWTALGFKLAQMLDFFTLDEANLRQDMVDRIKSFQETEGPERGYFLDPVQLKKGPDNWRFLPPRKEKDFNIRRAETRQAIVALKGETAAPDIPLDFMFETKDQIREFIRGLPWDTNPWHSGSHVSHLIVFLMTNAEVFGQPQAQTELLPVVLEELERFFRPEIGSWFTGNPAENHKINAAMKVYSGYDFLDTCPPGLETMLDYSLDAAIEAGACNHVDLMFVLQIASKHTDYRREEIKKIAFEALPVIKQHIQPDGGLCYSLDGTQRNYYGMKVSKGLPNIGDMHGTKLFTWSIALIADILGWREELGWRLPITLIKPL